MVSSLSSFYYPPSTSYIKEKLVNLWPVCHSDVTLKSETAKDLFSQSLSIIFFYLGYGGPFLFLIEFNSSANVAYTVKSLCDKKT